MVIIDVGSSRRAPATMIGEEEGAHDDDREILKTALDQKQHDLYRMIAL